MRVGMGYDVHKLTEGRKLILGGVDIPWEKGLLGHSDADVLIHAVMDALLGAAALGDIGKHFPDTDPAYKGISSVKLLAHVAGLLREHGYEVGNIDATIIAQKPKMAPHISQMRKNMAVGTWHYGIKDQCKSNDRRGTWVYRKRRGHFFSGYLPAYRNKELIQLKIISEERDMKLFNTMSRRKRRIRNRWNEGKVRMYVCGRQYTT